MGWQLNTDGGSRGNPGPAGCGFSLVEDGQVALEGGWYLGQATNNHAEYCALIWGLENALALGAAELSVQADSELMVKQMNGAYKVKNPDMKKLHARAQRLAQRFGRISFTHVRREHNKAADGMANAAMDARGPAGSYAVGFSEEEDACGTPSLFAGTAASPAAASGSSAAVPPAPPTGEARAGSPAAACAETQPAARAGGSPSQDGAGPGGGCVLLGITGCIAAYKACELVRLLQKRAPGVNVKVVMTQHAAEFVGPATFRALTGNEVAVGLFDEASAPIHHISLAKEADLFCIAPATANVIAKLAGGVADDLLTTTALATKAPLVLAPAMNAAMWADAATQANVARCRELGMHVIGPASGWQACGDVGQGRMSEPEEIADALFELLEHARSLAGKRVLVTAGPTHEPIDAVRYVANRSSGRQGYAIAEQAAARGAQVTLVSGPTALAAPAGVEFIGVQTAREMLEACRGPFARADAAVFVAAVADWRPASPAAGKLKHDGTPLTLQLEPNPDVAATLAAEKQGRYVVCFAAETGDPLPAARAKLSAKNADLVVANDVSSAQLGFGTPDNHVWLVTAQGARELPTASKQAIAGRILDEVAAALR